MRIKSDRQARNSDGDSSLGSNGGEDYSSTQFSGSSSDEEEESQIESEEMTSKK